MMRNIRVKAGSLTMLAELLNTKTAEAIWEALPVSSKVNTWGKEIYFSIPLKMDLENGQEVVHSGDLGYWPPGNAFCIFFGPTPASHGDEIRAASAVNVFGRLLDNPKMFEGVKQGDSIVVERV